MRSKFKNILIIIQYYYIKYLEDWQIYSKAVANDYDMCWCFFCTLINKLFPAKIAADSCQIASLVTIGQI